VLTNPDWQETSRADVKGALQSGLNELRLDAHNNGGAAALLAVLEIETAEGKKITVETGEGWEFTPDKGTDFKPAVIIAKLGAAPWGDVLTREGRAKGKAGKAAKPLVNEPATEPKDIVALPGFKVELLYTVPKVEQGSWVSMTVDPQGRIICCDQYGGLYRITAPPLGSSEKSKIEVIPSDIGGAHGLLYANHALYIMNNEHAHARLQAGHLAHEGHGRRPVRHGGITCAPSRAAASTARTPCSSRRTARASISTVATTPSCRTIGKSPAPPGASGAKTTSSRACGTRMDTRVASSRRAATLRRRTST